MRFNTISSTKRKCCVIRIVSNIALYLMSKLWAGKMVRMVTCQWIRSCPHFELNLTKHFQYIEADKTPPDKPTKFHTPAPLSTITNATTDYTRACLLSQSHHHLRLRKVDGLGMGTYVLDLLNMYHQVRPSDSLSIPVAVFTLKS